MGIKRNAGTPFHPDAVVRSKDVGLWVRRLWTILAVLLLFGAVDCHFEGQQCSRTPEPGVRVLESQASEMTAGVALAKLKPEQQDRVEAWREEGIRMAAELTGLPEAFFRWLEDKGVPVAEFVHFLVPFLEFIDMMESRNSTNPPPAQKRQAPATI